MELYPAIDIRAGRVVRVRRGDPRSEIAYQQDPIGLAEGYARDGARWMHVVDLDRVFGTGDQSTLIAELVRRVPVRWQAGGGIATADEAEALVQRGISRVVVRGSAAAGLEGMVRRVGGARLALALDVAAAASGTARGAGGLDRAGAETLARAAASASVRTVIYTDLGLEGRLGGADAAGAAALSRAVGVDVVVSEGVHSLAELAEIAAAGVAGAIVGRALLEGRFTLAEALSWSSR